MNARATVGVSRPLWAGLVRSEVATSLRTAVALAVRALDRVNGTHRFTETQALGVAGSDLNQMQRVMVR